jgi:hypothetical protein
MKCLIAEFEQFDTSDSHYYLKINGKTVAALLPSDFIKIVEALPVTVRSRKYVRDVVEAYYSKEAL